MTKIPGCCSFVVCAEEDTKETTVGVKLCTFTIRIEKVG